jgi:ABC-type glycerol-3-phosphate transport system substrate-binding protein
MYHKNVLQSAGIKMPAHPTWDQVAAIARKINRPGMAGIALDRGASPPDTMLGFVIVVGLGIAGAAALLGSGLKRAQRTA